MVNAKSQIKRTEITSSINSLVSLIFIEQKNNYYKINPDFVFNNKELLRKLFKTWGFDEKEDTVGDINKFFVEGHRQSFQQHLTKLSGMNEAEYREYTATITNNDQLRHHLYVVHYYSQSMPAGGIAAFDYSWIVFKCWAGYTLGHISEEDKWTYLADVIQLIKESFSNWEEYVFSYVIGRVYIASNLSDDFVRDYKVDIYKLMNPKYSPFPHFS
ncbi:hypothetical protein PAECIP111893_01981 [Paenibacillus plantiphilus]|uniref:DUF1266 domain-containing protein n=1 Tax=Paenibacillus plantiphilus TaxID=2905650 RepID=A0ABM9C3X5_9BACL|nr:DUF1266 domain-containing protein [Paenibacillus plantiphilus]CAH1203493.1 hypothetical protein PAECIP111893_01981 [Paenibacillus plantiphilus]